jgi:hypothetical protein
MSFVVKLKVRRLTKNSKGQITTDHWAVANCFVSTCTVTDLSRFSRMKRWPS